MDVDSLLDGASNKPSKKNKSNTPVIKVTGKLAKSVVSFVKSKRDEEDAKARMNKSKEEIEPKAKELHLKEVKKIGKPFANIKLATGDVEIQVDVAKEQYGKIDIDNEENLRDIFGDDYDDYFSKEREVKLSKDAMKDKKVLAALIKAIGKENISKYLEVTDFIKPTSKFHSDRFLAEDNEVSEKIAEVIDEEIVKPFAIAIRG